jgi:hypothetical protein
MASAGPNLSAQISAARSIGSNGRSRGFATGTRYPPAHFPDHDPAVPVVTYRDYWESGGLYSLVVTLRIDGRTVRSGPVTARHDATSLRLTCDEVLTLSDGVLASR